MHNLIPYKIHLSLWFVSTTCFALTTDQLVRDGQARPAKSCLGSILGISIGRGLAHRKIESCTGSPQLCSNAPKTMRDNCFFDPYLLNAKRVRMSFGANWSFLDDVLDLALTNQQGLISTQYYHTSPSIPLVHRVVDPRHTLRDTYASH